MSKATHIQGSFNAGELSPRLHGRVDIQKYATGCNTMENFLPLIQGGAVKRSGTQFVAEVRDSNSEVILIPFEFSTTQAYVLEFGHQYMRVYRDGGIQLEPDPANPTMTFPIKEISSAEPPVVEMFTDTGWEIGDTVYIQNLTRDSLVHGGAPALYNNRQFVVGAVTGSSTFSSNQVTLMTTEDPGVPIDGSSLFVDEGHGTAAEIGRVFALATPYTTLAGDPSGFANIGGLSWAQSADVLYLAHEEVAPRKLSRAAHHIWSIDEIEFDEPAYDPENTDSALFATVSIPTGSVYQQHQPKFQISDVDASLIPAKIWSAGIGGLIPSGTLCEINGITGNVDVAAALNGKSFRLITITNSAQLLDPETRANVDLTGTLAGASNPQPPDTAFIERRMLLTVSDPVLSSASTGGTFKLRELIAAEHGLFVPGDRNILADGDTLPSGGEAMAVNQLQAGATRFHDLNVYEKVTAAADTFATITGASRANPVVITAPGHGFVNGDRVEIVDVQGMIQINNAVFDVAGVSGTQFNIGIDGTSFGTFATGNGKARQPGHPLDTSGGRPPVHTSGVQSDGNWDWEYIHSGYGQVRIGEVFSAHRASVGFVSRLPDSVISSAGEEGMFGIKTATTDLQVSMIVTTGDVNNGSAVALAHGMSVGDKLFISNVVGANAEALNNKAFCVGAITDTTITLNDVDNNPIDGPRTFTGANTDGTGIVTHLKTRFWSLGAWHSASGFPRTVTFFEDRLWWGGNTSNPQTLWASRTGQYENHQVLAQDDSGMTLTLNTDQVNAIQWIDAGKALVVGSVGGEFIVSGWSDTEAITPRNIRVVRHANYGSQERTSPIRIGTAVLFVQRAGKKLRELVYDDLSDDYVAPDMTVLSDHITQAGIKYICFQQEPDRILWAVLEDGTLAGFTYDRLQQVTAWHRHLISGTDTEVESAAVIPHRSGSRDELWLVVKRTIDGATRRYIEVLQDTWSSTLPVSDAFFVDSGVTTTFETLSVNLYSVLNGVTDYVPAPATRNHPFLVFTHPAGELPLETARRIYIEYVTGMPELNGSEFIAYYDHALGEYAAGDGLVRTRWYLSHTDQTPIRADLYPSQVGAAIGTEYVQGGYLDWSGNTIVVTERTIDGLRHLEGETVEVLADGMAHPAKTVTDGEIMLDRASVKATVGLQYTGTLETMRIEAGGADGTAQGKTKRITNVVTRLYQTGPGLYVGPLDGQMDEFHTRLAGTEGETLPGSEMDTPLPLYDGDTPKMSYPEGYTQNGRVAISHKTPFPCTVTAIIVQLNTQDR